ncbi:hypothetical protein LK07_16315 [Streptomyces pluripotens]|uniref:Sensor domain-containing protein n=1 Tax=Streptomyces pluripotens TaxID=1355015 RepID=A0A221NZA4_9ACTN|nr:MULTISPECIES: hypothetical protein [Streptomyces]ARP71081.1 hypothetical protein LK06_015180 [Streptomyces pluripotens]ASN25329.1 hypothetical protein LK07_16315 [Streptomyces pluripotens]KIE25965.1 hypothetical protein LK08_16210 [Streptomyces sp. MUSC 125]MCH0557145.1 hypothetical protein [Streptomyces sp. MUM 16J]
MTPAIRSRALPLSLIAAGLLAVGSCAALGLNHPATAPQPLPTIDRPTPTPKASARADGSSLSDEQARAALITQADLGAPWTATHGAATWRDGLLKATTGAGQCQGLLDALYSDELLGAPARVAIGLDDSDTDAQLRYQIGARSPAEVDSTLAWLRTMPVQCARFTATTDLGIVEDVQVVDAPLPEVGDVRQGLRITLAGTTPDEQETVLTMEVAAVRVGTDAFALTNGGLGEVPNDATQAAVQIGALRLADVRRQGRAQV